MEILGNKNDNSIPISKKSMNHLASKSCNFSHIRMKRNGITHLEFALIEETTNWFRQISTSYDVMFS